MSHSTAVEQSLTEHFPGALADTARELLPNDQDDRVLLAIITLSDGDLERLAHFCDQATVDFRDVLYWAETPTEGNESKSYGELRSRLNLPPEARP